MIIRQTTGIFTNNRLWEYLTKENIKYTSHTYYKTGITEYKIFNVCEKYYKIGITEYKIFNVCENQLKKIDEILDN